MFFCPLTAVTKHLSSANDEEALALSSVKAAVLPLPLHISLKFAKNHSRHVLSKSDYVQAGWNRQHLRGFCPFFPHIVAAQVAVPPRVPVPGQKGSVVRSVFYQTSEACFRQLIPVVYGQLRSYSTGYVFPGSRIFILGLLSEVNQHSR